jgi:nucleotide-binding universal stress UspA family protein
VTNILVPLDHHRDLQLRAAYFALEFAKRTGAKVLFLNIRRERSDSQPNTLSAAHSGPLGEDLDHLINDSLMAGLQIESYVTNGDYVQRVTEFAEHHNVSRVILALPEDDGPRGAEAASRLNALKDRLSCALVTVRPRHDAEGPTSRAS